MGLCVERAPRVHTWSEEGSWSFSEASRCPTRMFACQKPRKAELIWRIPGLWASQAARLLLSALNDSIQTITNNSNEGNWRVHKRRHCQHWTSTKQFFFKVGMAASGLYRWRLEKRYPLRCCRLRGFYFFFICVGLFPNRVSFRRVSKWVNNTLPPSACSGYLSLFFAAMENAHRDWKAPFMQHCSKDFRIPLLHKSFN